MTLTRRSFLLGSAAAAGVLAAGALPVLAGAGGPGDWPSGRYEFQMDLAPLETEMSLEEAWFAWRTPPGGWVKIQPPLREFPVIRVRVEPTTIILAA